MEKRSKFQAIRRVLTHSLIVLVTLIAAEAIGMLFVMPLMKIDKGYIVIAGLGVLPLWGSLLAIVYTVDKRLRAVLSLVVITAITGLIFAI